MDVPVGPSLLSYLRKQKNKLLSSLHGVVLEKRWKMFEGRAVLDVQAVLISLLSTDEARGAKSICASVLDSL